MCAIRLCLLVKMHLSDRFHAIYHFSEHLLLLQQLLVLTIELILGVGFELLYLLQTMLHDLHGVSCLPEEVMIGLVTEV